MEINWIAVQIDVQTFVETKHASFPSTSMVVVISSTLLSPKLSSTPLDSLTCSASAVDGAGVGAVDGDTGTEMTAANTGKVLHRRGR